MAFCRRSHASLTILAAALTAVATISCETPDHQEIGGIGDEGKVPIPQEIFGGFTGAALGGIAGHLVAGVDPVASSRIFAGPSQYPPNDFAAYGILAFRSWASAEDVSRHMMICNAYVSSLPHAYKLKTPTSAQMVTVWPIDSDVEASVLNQKPRDAVCYRAVEHYGLVTSLLALKEAEFAGVEISGIGPFLLAWSPSKEKGEKDTIVLVSNLSHVTTYRQAQEIMLRWSIDIESNLELWKDGWNVDRIRTAIRLWVDEYGPKDTNVVWRYGIEEDPNHA
jgi:hypothetical protein